MRIYVDAFHTQKAGNSQAEYEDAFWPPGSHSTLRGEAARVAVADGATDSLFSGLWARLLVRGYAKDRTASEIGPDQLARAGRTWKRLVSRRDLPWYAEEKLQAGAFAALLGLELRESKAAGGEWSATACGDTCLFQLRAAEVIKAFPLTRSDQFSNSPVLVGSRTENCRASIEAATGAWMDGDCFYLMTDALAAWFLTKCEQGTVPWQILRDVTLARTPAFDEWVADLRAKHEIKNDDSTLVSISHW